MAEDAHSISLEIESWLPEKMTATVVLPSSATHVSMLDDRAILLNLDTGAYHALNAVGSVIWELFIPDRCLTHIHAEMCHRYNVDDETARTDLLELVARLYRFGLIRIEKSAS